MYNKRNNKRKIFPTAWCLMILFLLPLLAGHLYSQEQPPFKQLKVGDWWLVNIERMDIWKRVDRHSWVDAGEWKFEIKSKENGKLTVKVTNLNRPPDAPPWALTVIYSSAGNILDATFIVGDKTFKGETALKFVPLGRDGLSLGPPTRALMNAPMVTKRDVYSNRDVQMAKITNTKTGSYKLWRPQEPIWRYFNNEKEIPIRATLKKTSWWKK